MANDQFIETFREEALELLGSLEAALLELEENPDDPELLSAVFRVMHTIKGSAAMFGLDRIASFAHEVESILAALRDGKLHISSTLISNTLLARDHIREMLDEGNAPSEVLSSDMQEFLKNFREKVGFTQKAEAVIQAPVEQKVKENPLRTWLVKFIPGSETFRRGSNPLTIINELCAMGETVTIPDLESIPVLSTLDPETCHIGWNIFLTTKATENEIRDVFIFVEDFSTITIDLLPDLPDDEIYTARKLGEILVERGLVDKSRLQQTLGSQKKLGELLVSENVVRKTDLRVALEEQKHMQKLQKTKQASVDMSTIRVKSEKLDQLMLFVGELVTIHARILQTSRDYQASEEMNSVVEQFGRLTDELRSNTMSIRMVPIGTTFSSFKRLVRDLSAELGKSVELVTEGGETELDKTVIEKLNDPLIHIIRNSLDHGIEKPEIRRDRGKSESGTIRLSALQTGSSVYIIIEDDGNGLDAEAIRKKAISKGIVSADDILSDEDINKLIFASGFSTKEAVSAVSGRGVGMDVVNRQMELINGTISITTKPKQFTRITLKIPLTLAIIDGLLVRIGAEYFIIPLSVVVGCLEYIPAEQKNDHDIVVFHDKQLPFVNMRDYFSITGERELIEQMVVVNLKNQQVGILVDQVVGGNQTVIKPLGKLFRRAAGVSSATVLGDGSVALILDVEQIVEAKERADT